jgi:hypothetical protein
MANILQEREFWWVKIGRKQQIPIFWKIQMSCDRMYLTSYRCLWEVSSINLLLLIFIIRSHAFGQRMSSQISRLTVPQRINREDCRYYEIGRTQCHSVAIKIITIHVIEVVISITTIITYLHNYI